MLKKYSNALFAWLQNPLHVFLLLCSLVPIYLAILLMDTYGRNIPIADQWFSSVDTAIATADGSLTFDHLLRSHNGHRAVFTQIVTVIATLLTDWNIKTEAYINLVLVLLNFGLFVALFYHHAPDSVHLIMLPFSLMLFSLYQDNNLIASFYNGWHFILFFFLLGLWILQHYPPGWKPLIAAAVCGVCATFSFGNGITVWGLMLVALWLLGYRRWEQFLFWVVVSAISIYLYVHNSGIGVSETEASGISWTNPVLLLHFTLAFLGNPFGYFNVDTGTKLGALGLVMLAANFLYLIDFRLGRNWADWRVGTRSIASVIQTITDKVKPFAVWIALVGYAIGGAVVTGLSRLNGDEGRLWMAMGQRYTAISVPFWLTLIAFMVMATRKIVQKANGARWLMYANFITTAILLAMYLRSNFWSLQTINFRYNGFELGFEREPGTYTDEENCVLFYPLRRDQECIDALPYSGLNVIIPEKLYRLAAYRLTIFADQEPANILPETYQPDSPIIINSPSAWLNLYVREWMLDGISDEDLFHIAPPPEAPISLAPKPLTNLVESLTPETLEQIQAFTGDAEQIWYISTPETAADDPVFSAAMNERGYFATLFPIFHPRYGQGKFSVFRFQRAPETLETLFSFGDENINLLAWETFGADGVQACDEIRIQSWWEAEVVPTFNYVTSFMLLNGEGARMTNTDDSIGLTQMQLWFPDQLYFDERVLSIPCDLPPGEYDLAVNLYWDTGNDFQYLPIVDAAGEGVSEQAILWAIQVE